MRRRSTPAWLGGLMAVVLVVAACSSSEAGFDQGGPTVPTASSPGTTATTSQPSTTSTTVTAPTTTTVPPPPPRNPRYIVPENEVAREAKQLASDIAYSLTTYEESDYPVARLLNIAGADGLELLTEASEPLTHPDRWSRGEIVYPQLGGLTSDKVSVMVVTRQTVGTGPDPEFSIVRTLDVRLVEGETGWEFDELASAGGVFATVEDLELAHAVAADPRIELPDSARLDILDGEASPLLLKVMLEIADITPYGVTVMATGHPYHVFETNRVSHHTIGRAIDIYRVGDRRVIDDRESGSTTHGLVRWLWGNPEIIQVGSPWDVDAGYKKRSFQNTVHQDHIHVAVIGPNDPTWVPALGDLVWEDLDADGIQDDGEPGIGDVTVRLFDDTGDEVATTTTDSSGAYEFQNLSWGDWHIEIDIPSGYRVSPRDQGSDDARDSDVDASGEMPSTFLDPREDDPKWDAGLYRPASIGDRVWEDLDGDGIQDAGEPGIAGVTVRLFDGDLVEVATAHTDANGEYSFADLMPGVYHIEVGIPGGYLASVRDRGSDDATDSDIDSGGVMAATALVSNENDRRWDAGLIRPASIGDMVWEDLDADGIRDAGEPGLAGVAVRLLGSGGEVVRSTVTGADGKYGFSNLRPGDYRVEIEIPEGYEASPPDVGDDDAVDSDIDENGAMALTSLGQAESDTRWDAGLVPLAP